MSSNVISQVNNISSIKKFITTNNIVGTCAGVSVGLAAKDSINSLVEDVLGPTIIIFLHGLNIDWLTNYLPINNNNNLNILKFMKNLSTFFFTIIISFIFVYFAFGYLLGVNTLGDSNNTKSSESPSSPSFPTHNEENTSVSSSDLFTTISGLSSKYPLKENFVDYLSYSN